MKETEEKQMGETEKGMDPFAKAVVEGVDLKKGLERYEKAYAEILRAWCMHTPVLLEKLRTLTGQFNAEAPDSVLGVARGVAFNEYTTTVHGVKGSTFGICADGTAQKAADLEAASRRNDLQFIAANNEPLIEETLSLHKNLEKLLADIAGQGPAKPAAKSPDTALLAEFLEACKQFKSTRMEEILGKLEAFEYESGGELVQWLREQTDNLEYDAIQEKLESMSN
jgi:hypothetical protein